MMDGRYGSTCSMNECIGACHTGLLDAWWLWNDGQLVGMRALFWDGGRAKGRGLAHEARPRHLEPIEALYDMCEIFTFASNLATETATPYVVRISFSNIEGTMLHIHTPNWSPLWGAYKPHGNCITLAPAIVMPCLTTESYAPLALERILDLLGHYGMDRKAPRCKLEREQRWFYARQLTAVRGARRGDLCSDVYP